MVDLLVRATRMMAAMIAAFSVLIAVPAAANNAATLNVLGFSADGAVFAFEEYGIQDGSGFPFANRFYIDTATDDFLPGTPIRRRIDDETASVAEVRALARGEGETIVSDSELDANRGFLAGFNAIAEASADPTRIAVYPRPVVLPVDTPVEFRLEEIVFAPGPHCFDLRPTEIGFRLVQIDARPGGETRLLHEDSRVPASRGCAQGYTFGGVQILPAGGDIVIAVLIALESLGFEGSDFRWMAVTTRQPL